MSRWFRHYAGMMRDEKLVRVALRSKQPVERVLWVWGVILESAAEIDDGGRFEIDSAELAYFLRSDQGDIDAILDALEGIGRTANGAVAKWGSRQFQSDRSAERQQRHRGRLKGVGDDERKAGDGQVTAASRHGDAPETEQIQNTDTEAEKKERARGALAVRSPAIDEKFDKFWELYPHKVGKQAAHKAFSRIAKSRVTTFELLMLGLRSYVAKTDDRPWCNPATWLNEGRWDDQPAPEIPRNGSEKSILAACDRQIEKFGGYEAAARYVPGSSGPRPLGVDYQPLPASPKLISSR